MVLSGVSFEGTCGGNLEGAGPGEGDTLVNSEINRVGNKLGIYYVEVIDITLIVTYRSKPGGDEGSWPVLAVGSYGGVRDGNLEDGIEEF